jgi:NAD(P)-dependent dehydrogenase (short-subunit alcohol dehydrogenase family)
MAHIGGGALVIGGASGIGRACANALMAHGWPTVIADLKPPADDPGAIAVDVRDRDALHAAAAEASERHDGIGAVVYAAGTARVTPILDIAGDEWDLVLGVNLTGAMNALQATAPYIPSGGSFALISSVDSKAPVAGLAHYSAAKAGGEALVRAAALELGPRGIRVNAILPGVVSTPLMAPMLERPGVTEAFIHQTPLGRIAEGADVADVVAFLASPSARWVTGVSLPVDGGMSLREHPELLEAPQPTSPH